MQERKKNWVPTSYLREEDKIRRWVFLSYESLKSKKRRIFFADEQDTRASTGKPRKPLSLPGLVYRRKARRWLQQRQGSVCPKPRIPFFLFTSIWVWKRPISVEVSAPTRLGLQGSHVRKKFRKWTTLRSESSTLKGLLYAPLQQKQYLKRTTLRR